MEKWFMSVLHFLNFKGAPVQNEVVKVAVLGGFECGYYIMTLFGISAVCFLSFLVGYFLQLTQISKTMETRRRVIHETVIRAVWAADNPRLHLQRLRFIDGGQSYSQLCEANLNLMLPIEDLDRVSAPPMLVADDNQSDQEPDDNFSSSVESDDSSVGGSEEKETQTEKSEADSYPKKNLESYKNYLNYLREKKLLSLKTNCPKSVNNDSEKSTLFSMGRSFTTSSLSTKENTRPIHDCLKRKPASSATNSPCKSNAKSSNYGRITPKKTAMNCLETTRFSNKSPLFCNQPTKKATEKSGFNKPAQQSTKANPYIAAEATLKPTPKSTPKLTPKQTLKPTPNRTPNNTPKLTSNQTLKVTPRLTPTHLPSLIPKLIPKPPSKLIPKLAPKLIEKKTAKQSSVSGPIVNNNGKHSNVKSRLFSHLTNVSLGARMNGIKKRNPSLVANRAKVTSVNQDSGTKDAGCKVEKNFSKLPLKATIDKTTRINVELKKSEALPAPASLISTLHQPHTLSFSKEVLPNNEVPETNSPLKIKPEFLGKKTTASINFISQSPTKGKGLKEFPQSSEEFSTAPQQLTIIAPENAIVGTPTMENQESLVIESGNSLVDSSVVEPKSSNEISNEDNCEPSEEQNISDESLKELKSPEHSDLHFSGVNTSVSLLLSEPSSDVAKLSQETVDINLQINHKVKDIATDKIVLIDDIKELENDTGSRPKEEEKNGLLTQEDGKRNSISNGIVPVCKSRIPVHAFRQKLFRDNTVIKPPNPQPKVRALSDLSADAISRIPVHIARNKLQKPSLENGVETKICTQTIPILLAPAAVPEPEPESTFTHSAALVQPAKIALGIPNRQARPAFVDSKLPVHVNAFKNRIRSLSSSSFDVQTLFKKDLHLNDPEKASSSYIL